jgi:hypothetical protein
MTTHLPLHQSRIEHRRIYHELMMFRNLLLSRKIRNQLSNYILYIKYINLCKYYIINSLLQYFH